MKYVIRWQRKRHGTIGAYEDSLSRMLALLASWRRPEGVAVHQCVVRAGGTGGYAVIETNDLETVNEATRAFAGFNFAIEPVLDLEPGLAAGGQAVGRTAEA